MRAAARRTPFKGCNRTLLKAFVESVYNAIDKSKAFKERHDMYRATSSRMFIGGIVFKCWNGQYTGVKRGTTLLKVSLFYLFFMFRGHLCNPELQNCDT